MSAPVAAMAERVWTSKTCEILYVPVSLKGWAAAGAAAASPSSNRARISPSADGIWQAGRDRWFLNMVFLSEAGSSHRLRAHEARFASDSTPRLTGLIDGPSSEKAPIPRLTAHARLDGIRRVQQRLPLGGRESAIADIGVELIDEGAQLATGRGDLPRFQLDEGLSELGDQRIGLVLRQRALRDQCVDLSDERRDQALGGRRLEGADVAGTKLLAHHSTLIRGETGRVVARVERRAAGEERVRVRRAAVVGTRSEERVDPRQVAGAGHARAVAVEAVVGAGGGAREEAVPSGDAGDDRVGQGRTGSACTVVGDPSTGSRSRLVRGERDIEQMKR